MKLEYILLLYPIIGFFIVLLAQKVFKYKVQSILEAVLFILLWPATLFLLVMYLIGTAVDYFKEK